MARYLVTGGAGFIGSNVVEELLRRGEEVRVFDDFSEGKHENLAAFIKKIELVKGDVRNLKQLKKAVSGVDYIIHEAAIRSVPRSVDDPLGANEVNVTGTLNVLVAARDAGVERVVFASSSSVYGENETLPQVETMLPCPVSPYATSKLTGEHYCSTFYKVYGLETVSLRYFNVFGPRQDPHSQYANVIPIFILALLNDRPVEVHGDGLQARDFTYIADTVQATLLAARAPKVAGEVFNVACGEKFSILDLVHELERIVGKSLKYSHTAPRRGDVRYTLADASKAQKMLGYKVNFSFRDGLKETVEWFKKTKEGGVKSSSPLL